ncbi:MAG: TetR/AcrR family transcriptional regulator [Treponema sp.]|nr:TetR/AcrR family transcriptional regulator [Treponema sp.]
MTNDDVIKAAFNVWGQEFYKTTSLAKLAESLGVSKPALYRHFPDKQSLQKAMEERYFDDYVTAMKPVIEETQKKDSWQERLLTMVEFFSGYYARHFDYFIYSIIEMHDQKQPPFFNEEAIIKRGVSFEKLKLDFSEQQPSILFLAGVSAFFGTGMFHKRRFGIKDNKIKKEYLHEYWFSKAPSEEEVGNFSRSIAELVRLGLLFEEAAVNTLPYEELEKTDEEFLVAPDPLLKAVAEVVAEEGPWNASMETVAKRSGLSKSGLYAHFKSKEDMLSRLFMTEFDRVGQYTARRTASGKNREERLYLAIVSITDYLRTRPEILIALNWVRIQQLELDISAPAALYNFFRDLKVAVSLDDIWEKTIHWILFLLIAVLKYYYVIDTNIEKKAENEFDYNCLRRLFRFISLGIEGFGEKSQVPIIFFQ